MPQIKEKMLKAKNACLNCTELFIRIEMPLSSGVKVTARAMINKRLEDVEISGVRDFYKIAQQYRLDNPKEKWNVMEINMTNENSVIIKTNFDQNLQEDAEDAVR
ncbi:MAG: hypothetical protein NTX75_02850 [Proteobacteria bacterium]|nr:hypothetical protein [Pseudomonadota bacterium]